MSNDLKIAIFEIAGFFFNSPTADALWNALPLSGEVHVWGDEIYFSVPVHVPLEEGAVEVVAKGDLAYWPTGPACCLFFGPTPISRPGEIRPASAVNVFGGLTGDLSVLKQISEGSTLMISKAGS